MALQKLVLLVAIAGLLPAAPTAGRGLPLSEADAGSRTLEARLTSGLAFGGGLVECWKALLQLKSCADEFVLFFFDGEAHLGADCCRAIQLITRQCWPAMLTSAGLTVAEADVLRGYCDAEAATPPAPEGDAGAPSPAVTLAWVREHHV